MNEMPFPFMMERLNQSLVVKRIKWFELDKNGYDDSVMQHSQNLSDSYYPICDGPVISPDKPMNIPSLDLRIVE